ncbi:MAG: hypothetical protein ABJL99_00720 [Aliishimia sp.]
MIDQAVSELGKVIQQNACMFKDAIRASVEMSMDAPELSSLIEGFVTCQENGNQRQLA